MQTSKTFFFLLSITLLATSRASYRRYEGNEDSSIDSADGTIEAGYSDEEETPDAGDSSDILDVKVFDTGEADRNITEGGEEKRDEGTSNNFPPCIPNCPELEWVTIPGGTFIMGDAERSPRREVTIPDFRMLKTKVTVSQYRNCVDAGVCSGLSCMNIQECNFNAPGRDSYPVNRISWEGAKAFSE